MDAARMAAQSDPLRNKHFRRRWLEPPGWGETGPAIGLAGPGISKAQQQTEVSLMARIIQRAIDLDRRADSELALGRHHIAERLSHQAAQMREVWV